jgi:hypothetical protein
MLYNRVNGFHIDTVDAREALKGMMVLLAVVREAENTNAISPALERHIDKRIQLKPRSYLSR